MFTHYRTLGIILDKKDRGEADQIFTIFSEDFGMVEVLGKAIRKISSKLRAGMEVFYFSEIEFIEGRAYKTLTDAMLRKKYFSSAAAIGNLGLAWRIAELTKELMPICQEDRVVFIFLKRIFEELQVQLPKEKQILFLLFFLWNFISILGYKPELSFCVKCNREITELIGGFSLPDGGVVCRLCFSGIEKRDRIVIEFNSVKVIRFFLSNPWAVVKKLKIETSLLSQLRQVSLKYLHFLAGSLQTT